MSRTAGRLIVVLLLAVFVLLALLLRTQSGASAPGPSQLAPRDQREAVVLNPAQADHVLTEMRGLLTSVRDIQSAMAADDWAEVSAAAQAQGTGRGQRPPEGLRQRQPPGNYSFRGIRRGSTGNEAQARSKLYGAGALFLRPDYLRRLRCVVH